LLQATHFFVNIRSSVTHFSELPGNTTHFQNESKETWTLILVFHPLHIFGNLSPCPAANTLLVLHQVSWACNQWRDRSP